MNEQQLIVPARRDFLGAAAAKLSAATVVLMAGTGMSGAKQARAQGMSRDVDILNVALGLELTRAPDPRVRRSRPVKLWKP